MISFLPPTQNVCFSILSLTEGAEAVENIAIVMDSKDEMKAAKVAANMAAFTDMNTNTMEDDFSER